jgi:hypothetical protein
MSDMEDVIDSAHIESKASAQYEDENDMDGPEFTDEQLNLPKFNPISASLLNEGSPEYIRIPVPPHRYTPLKTHWLELYTPIVEHMKLQVRFNPKKRCVEMRNSTQTDVPNALQKSAGKYINISTYIFINYLIKYMKLFFLLFFCFFIFFYYFWLIILLLSTHIIYLKYISIL